MRFQHEQGPKTPRPIRNQLYIPTGPVRTRYGANMELVSVADPGFSRGGGVNPPGGA